MIPLVDLNAQYRSIQNEIDAAINKCISDGNFIKGRVVSDFENAFAGYLGAEYCIGCGNGTDALEIILTSLDIGPGDEVLVPALTWISTAEAVNNVGAEPVFVDINPDTYTIDHNKIEKKITGNTKAIIPVHLYGCPADMKEIMNIASRNGLFVIEDCAQAHGAEYFGKKVGTFGIASSFSFFPTKNLGAFGDAGAVVTNNLDIAEKVRMISNHGQLIEKHNHIRLGRNSRLDSIQASVLKVKLKYLDDWNKKRQEAAAFYISRLKANREFRLPYSGKDKNHVYHLFVVTCRQREKVIQLLDEEKISWGIHYPRALPFVGTYKYKEHKSEDFPVAGRITSEVISIPIYPEITELQLAAVCDRLLKYGN